MRGPMLYVGAMLALVACGATEPREPGHVEVDAPYPVTVVLEYPDGDPRCGKGNTPKMPCRYKVGLRNGSPRPVTFWSLEPGRYAVSLLYAPCGLGYRASARVAYRPVLVGPGDVTRIAFREHPSQLSCGAGP